MTRIESCQSACKKSVSPRKTGAAVHDMIQIATRRNPYVQLYLYPAKVQGEGAAQSIAGGISFWMNLCGRYFSGKARRRLNGRLVGAFNEEIAGNL